MEAYPVSGAKVTSTSVSQSSHLYLYSTFNNTDCVKSMDLSLAETLVMLSGIHHPNLHIVLPDFQIAVFLYR